MVTSCREKKLYVFPDVETWDIEVITNLGRKLTCMVANDLDLEQERVSTSRDIILRFGGNCIDCCIPRGKGTFNYLEEVEWFDENIIVETSRDSYRCRADGDRIHREAKPTFSAMKK